MEQSILKSVKKLIGLGESYTPYDQDILTYINSAFSTLNQLGIGPAAGFAIEDDTTTWDAFIGNDYRLSSVKTYVHIHVRLLFDPPSTSYAIAAFEKQIEQLTWRLNVTREGDEWTDPNPVSVMSEN